MHGLFSSSSSANLLRVVGGWLVVVFSLGAGALTIWALIDSSRRERWPDEGPAWRLWIGLAICGAGVALGVWMIVGGLA